MQLSQSGAETAEGIWAEPSLLFLEEIPGSLGYGDDARALQFCAKEPEGYSERWGLRICSDGVGVPIRGIRGP